MAQARPARGGLLRYCRVGRWQSAIAFALLLAVVFARASRREIPDALFVSDGFGYYVYLPSLVIDHDLDLSNQLPRVPYEAQKSYFNRIDRTGLRADPFPVGAAVLWSPFFVAAHAAVSAMRALGAPLPADGFGFWYELPVYCGAFLFGLAGAWLIQRLIGDLFTPRVVDQTMCAVVLASPFAYYLLVEPDMSHVTAAFAIALFLYLLWRAMRHADVRLVSWIAIGAAAGAAALVRPYNGLIAAAALPAVLFIVGQRRDSLLTAATRLAACALSAFIVFLPQVAVSTVLYGRLTWLPPGTGYDEMMWAHPNVLGLAVSIFSMFPVLVLGFVGLVPTRAALDGARADDTADAARDAFLRYVAPALLLVLLVVMYVTASYPRGSTFGDSLGQRRIVDWAAVLAVGIASICAAVPERWRNAFDRALVVVAIADVLVAALYVAKITPPWGGTGLLGLG